VAEDKLFNYYERQDILPTFGNLKSAADLAAYAAQRHELFSSKLMLPPRMFRHSEVLEFGPDSGENALVFAGWGASMTLAEPNQQAHPRIQAYFSRFGRADGLRELVLSDVEGFDHARRFDMIDAEGFIYTIQPMARWLGVFHRLLQPDGYAVISYYERCGGFFELALKAIHAATKMLTRLPPLETAKLLFTAKWDSIPHTRSFESWLMDVLENPFVRQRYFLDAARLCEAAHELGFQIHSAWPSYRDGLDVYWHKKMLPDGEQLRRIAQHLRRSRLSFVGGRKLYMIGDVAAVDAISALIDALVVDVDATIDEPSPARLARVVANLAALGKMIGETDILSDDASDTAVLLAAIDSFTGIFEALGQGDVAKVTALTRSDPAFIESWGQPTHFLVLRKPAEAPQARI
jgi:hypothetical protein